MATTSTDRQGGMESGTATQDRRQGVNASAAVKVPCVVATTANITLSGGQTIDGVAIVSGDRVLVKDQTDGIENGIYDADTSAWNRAPDWDGSLDIKKGTLTYVHSGTVGIGWYEVTTADTITPGTTSTTIAKITSSILGLVIGTDVQAWDAVLDATTASFLTADETKLDGIEALADVTDATNVAAAGGVLDTGNETIAGVKTFSSDPLIPDEAYAAGWDTKLEPPTKNAVYDKIESFGLQTRLFAIKGSDTSRDTTTTLADDPDLTVTLLANKTYEFKSMLHIISTSTTPEFKYEWVEVDGLYHFSTSVGGDDGTSITFTGVYDSRGSLQQDLAANANRYLIFSGLIQTGGTAGVFKLQWAQNVSDATATTLKAGSFMRATQLN